MTTSRLQDLQQERQEVNDQQDLLLRKQDALMGGATEAELSMLHPLHTPHTQLKQHTRYIFLTHTLYILLTRSPRAHLKQHTSHTQLIHSSHTYSFPHM